MAYPYNAQGVDEQYGAIERALRAARKRFDTPRVDTTDDFLAYKAGQDPYGNQPWQPTPVYKHEIIRDIQDALGVDAATADVIVEEYLQGGGTTGNPQIDSAIRGAIESRENAVAPSRSPSTDDRAPAERTGPGSQPADPARSPSPGIGLGLESMGPVPIGDIDEGLSFDQSRVAGASPLNVDDVASAGFTRGSVGTLGAPGYGSQNEAPPATGFSRVGSFAQPAMKDRDLDWFNDPRFTQNPMREVYGPPVPAAPNVSVPTPELSFDPRSPAISLDVATPALSMQRGAPAISVDVPTPDLSYSRAAPAVDFDVPTRGLAYSPVAPAFDALTQPNPIAMARNAPAVDVDVATPSLSYGMASPSFDVETFGPVVPTALTMPPVGAVSEPNVPPGGYRGFGADDLASVADSEEPNVGPGYSPAPQSAGILGPYSAQRAALGPLLRVAPAAPVSTPVDASRSAGRGVAGPASELTAAQDYDFDPASIMAMTPGQRLSAVAQGLDADVTRSRSGKVSGVVMHETAGVSSMPRGVISAANERNAGAHYYIDIQGVVHQMVPDNMVIGHTDAGRGHSRDARPDLRNANTIGIEIQTAPGKKPNEAQVRAAAGLTRALADKYGFSIQKDVVGHGELSNNRENREGMSVVNSLRGAPTDDARAETTLSDAPGNRANVPVKDRGVTRGMGRQSSIGGIINGLLGIQSAEAAPMGSAMGVGARGAQQQAANPAYAVDDMMGVPERNFYDRVVGPMFNPNVRSLTIDPAVIDEDAARMREVDPMGIGEEQIGPVVVDPVSPASFTPQSAGLGAASGENTSGGLGMAGSSGVGTGGPGGGSPGASLSGGGTGTGGSVTGGGTAGTSGGPGSPSSSAGSPAGGTVASGPGGAASSGDPDGESDAVGETAGQGVAGMGAGSMGRGGNADPVSATVGAVGISPAEAAAVSQGLADSVARGQMSAQEAAAVAASLGVSLSLSESANEEVESTPLESTQVDFEGTAMDVPAGVAIGAAPADLGLQGIGMQGFAADPVGAEMFGGAALGQGAIDTAGMGSIDTTGGSLGIGGLGLGDMGFGSSMSEAAGVDTGDRSSDDSSDDTDGSPASDGQGITGGGMGGVDGSSAGAADGSSDSDSDSSSDSSSSGGVSGGSDGGGGGDSGGMGGSDGGVGDISGDNGDMGGNDISGGNDGDGGQSTSGWAYGGIVDGDMDAKIARALRAARKMHRKKKADGGKVTPGGEIIHSAVYKMPNGYMEETVIQRALKAATRR